MYMDPCMRVLCRDSDVSAGPYLCQFSGSDVFSFQVPTLYGVTKGEMYTVLGLSPTLGFVGRVPEGPGVSNTAVPVPAPGNRRCK